MNLVISHLLGGGLALAETSYLLLANIAVMRFRERRHVAARHTVGVSVLVPAHDDFPGLESCLRSICAQDYADFEVIVGLHGPSAPARATIERVIRDLPDRAIRLVIDERRVGANPKNCNLANIYPLARHDVIAMVDSDVRLRVDFLTSVVAMLDEPAVGAVTCLYAAQPRPTLAARLGALAINDWTIPSGLIDGLFRSGTVCYGAAIVARRQAIEDVGGFVAMASAVAQDHVFGEELKCRGWRVELAPYLVETLVSEEDIARLFRRERRWNRAVRACRPLDHALSVVTHALPLALVLSLLPGANPIGLALVAAAATLRLLLHALVRRRLGLLDRAAPWLLPLREALSLAIWISAFFGRTMRWGDRVLHVTGRSSMIEKEATR